MEATSSPSESDQSPGSRVANEPEILSPSASTEKIDDNVEDNLSPRSATRRKSVYKARQISRAHKLSKLQTDSDSKKKDAVDMPLSARTPIANKFSTRVRSISSSEVLIQSDPPLTAPPSYPPPAFPSIKPQPLSTSALDSPSQDQRSSMSLDLSIETSQEISTPIRKESAEKILRPQDVNVGHAILNRENSNKHHSKELFIRHRRSKVFKTDLNQNVDPLNPSCHVCLQAISNSVTTFQILDRYYHPDCFNCFSCKTSLKSSRNYHVGNDNHPLCSVCFNQQTGQNLSLISLNT